jgi:hypothetical protein
MYNLQGKPDTHATYTSCAGPRTPLVRFLRAFPIRGNHSRWPNRVVQIHCSWEKVLPTPPLSPAEWPTGPASVSLPNTTIKEVHLNQTSVDEHATRLTGCISPICDQYVQYLLVGPTHRPLTDTGRGYNHEDAILPHHTLQPSQPTVLRFPPKGPAWS